MEISQYKAELEAVLFASGEPVEIERSNSTGFSFSSVNYILKIFKNGLLNRLFPPLYNWEPYHTSSFQIKSQ